MLIKSCLSAGIDRIYISLDFPANDAARDDVQLCREIIGKFEALYPGKIHSKIATANLGCAISVLSACDWVFEKEDFAIILEDDCIPSLDFFEFVRHGRVEMNLNPQIFLVCGTQFTPEYITKNKWHLSSYPLIWGWATSQIKWKLIKNCYLNLDKIGNAHDFNSFSEFVFWKSGTRRALQGFVDAWDTPLVYLLRHLGGTVLLPGSNLVLNSGNDSVATHTLTNSVWLNRHYGTYSPVSMAPVISQEVDSWLRQFFYCISPRHIFTTRLTLLFDAIGLNKKLRKPLILRWLSHPIDY